jgi:glycosyltransferase involved in cell wall biosynthesis
MRIIHITPYYPPHLGGMENTVKELVERTAKMGLDICVYTSDEDGKKKLTLKNSLIVHRLKSIKIPGIPLIIPQLPFRLFSVIDKNTIIHVHYILNPFIDLGVVVSKMKKGKIVTQVHIDPQPSGPFGFLNPAYKRLFWKRIFSLSDVVICQTEDYLELISVKYSVEPNKCVIIPSGVDLKKFNTVNKHKGSDEIRDLLFVGRLSKQKNLDMLLSAFKLLQKECELTLHIVGDGERRKMIQQRIAKENLRNVILHGRVSDEELRNLYQKSDIFVLPSLYESFPLVLLEAMASGLPIVASDIPGIRSVVGGCGILVKPTPENFASAIAKLIKNESLREELIRKGKEKVKSYDWDVIAKRTLKVYYSVLSNS